MSSSKSTLAFYEGKTGGEKKGGAGSLTRPSRSGGGGGEGGMLKPPSALGLLTGAAELEKPRSPINLGTGAELVLPDGQKRNRRQALKTEIGLGGGPPSGQQVQSDADTDASGASTEGEQGEAKEEEGVVAALLSQVESRMLLADAKAARQQEATVRLLEEAEERNMRRMEAQTEMLARAIQRLQVAAPKPPKPTASALGALGKSLLGYPATELEGMEEQAAAGNGGVDIASAFFESMRVQGRCEAAMAARLQRSPVPERSRNEIMLLSHTVDLLEGVTGGKPARELLVRRICGIFLAEQAGGDWSMAEVLTPNLGVQVLPQDVLHGVIRDSKRHAALYGGRAGKTEKGSAKDDKEVKELRNKVKQMKAELSALHKKVYPQHQK